MGNLLARVGLWLARKSLSFTATDDEVLRKFFATHPIIASQLGYSEPSYTGKTINEYTALNLSTVWACKRNIAETLSCLPLHILETTTSGKRVASEHPADWVLNREANPDMSARQLRETLTGHCVIWGNAYAKIVRRGGTGQTIGLWPLAPNAVRAERKDGELRYLVLESNNWVPYPPREIFHLAGLGFDGQTGYSVISMARQALGLAAIQDEYAGRFFAAGGRRPYLLKKATKFKSDADADNFREKWNTAYGGSEGLHKAPILEGDIGYQELGMPLEDMQLLEGRKWSVPEICRWFRMYPFMVGHMEQLTFNNVEQLSIQAVQYTYGAWMKRWETEIDRQLLGPGEKLRYYSKHNQDALLRGDFKTRMEGYAIGRMNGFVSADEVRNREDWDPIPGGAGKAYYIPLNWQTVPGTGEPTAAELAALAKANQQQGGNSDGDATQGGTVRTEGNQ